MALVFAGKQVKVEDVRRIAGNLAAMLRDHSVDGMQFKTQLETWSDADMISEFGLTQAEVNAIKGFYIGDLPAIYNALTASVWIKQLLGTGV